MFQEDRTKMEFDKHKTAKRVFFYGFATFCCLQNATGKVLALLNFRSSVTQKLFKNIIFHYIESIIENMINDARKLFFLRVERFLTDIKQELKSARTLLLRLTKNGRYSRSL